METQVTAGNGRFKMLGPGIEQRGQGGGEGRLRLLQGQRSAGSAASIKAGDHDYHLHVVELHNTGANNGDDPAELRRPVFGGHGKAAASGNWSSSADMSLGGSIDPGGEPGRVACRSPSTAGAKRLLLPMASVRDIATIPGELFAKFQTAFYADPVDAVFKALGVE